MRSNAGTLSESAAANEKTKPQPKVRKSSSLPAETVDYLKAWMMSPEHVAHPYPTEREKARIMADTGIELKQLTNWFVNNRKRFWKPRVEARLQKQAKQMETAALTIARNGDSNALVFPPSAQSQPYMTVPRQNISHPGSRNHITTADNHEDPHTVSIGSSSSLSSESDNNSFGDDDDAVFNGNRMVQIIDKDGIVAFKRTRCVTLDSDDDHYVSWPTKRRRTTTKYADVDLVPNDSPRPDFLTKDMKTWRDVCRSARHGFEHSLPTLEEAARMFGYTD